MPELNLSNVIDVAVLGTPSILGLPDINTAALFTHEVPTWNDPYKLYVSAADVATDFGSGSVAAGIAAAFFAQNPNPLLTGGYLAIITLQVAETIQAAITRIGNTVYYFGILLDQLITDGGVASDLATAVQALDKLLFFPSNNAAHLEPGGIIDLFRTGSKTNTRGLFHANEAINFAAAYAGRALSTDFNASLTSQTIHLKELATIDVDGTVDETRLAKAGAAGADVYVSIAGLPCVFSSGGNLYFDQAYQRKWLKMALQTAGFNFLKSTNTKIAQTEEGMEGLKDEFRKVCAQAVANGYAAPGDWGGDKFGDPVALVRNVAGIGYYVYSTPLLRQSKSDRAARKAAAIQIAIKEAGAIHSANVIANVDL